MSSAIKTTTFGRDARASSLAGAQPPRSRTSHDALRTRMKRESIERALLVHRIEPVRPSIPAELVLAALTVAGCRSPSGESAELRAIASDAERWIRSCAQQDESGMRWPTNPEQPGSLDTSLYAGSPGVILFLIAMHRASGDEHYLDEARSGALALVAEA